MSQTNNKFGKGNSVFLHPHPQADSEVLKSLWTDILTKNPGVKHLLLPEYQHNYYDPPYDETTAVFLNKLYTKWPLRRQRLIRKFLPEQLYQFKALVSKLPYSQLQQLREQIYISRIGHLGTNHPCDYTRRHWIYRLANGNEVVTSDTIKNLPTAEILRWYTTAINNLYTDSAEEEYLRYKLCMGNRLPLVNQVGPYNPAHYDPADNVEPPRAVPTHACRALMPMVHEAHRHWTKIIQGDCGRHFKPFHTALVANRDLNASLVAYEKIQRCAIGREIRARYMTDKPVLLPAYQFFGRYISDAIPHIFTNWLSIRSNDVIKFKERDSDELPIFSGQNLHQIKPLLDELRQELIAEGRLAPEPLSQTTSPAHFSPFDHKPMLTLSNQTSVQDGGWLSLGKRFFGSTENNQNNINNNPNSHQVPLQNPNGLGSTLTYIDTPYETSTIGRPLTPRELNQQQLDRYGITSPVYDNDWNSQGREEDDNKNQQPQEYSPFQGQMTEDHKGYYDFLRSSPVLLDDDSLLVRAQNDGVPPNTNRNEAQLIALFDQQYKNGG